MAIDKVEAARIFWNDVILKGLAYQGATPALSDEALKALADLVERQRVGRFDEAMTDEQLKAVDASTGVLQAVAGLVSSGYARLTEARGFETPPTATEELKQVYIIASQIIKVCKVKSHPDFDKDEEDNLKPDVAVMQEAVSINEVENLKQYIKEYDAKIKNLIAQLETLNANV